MLKVFLLFLFLIGLSLNSALAEDWTTTDGKTYANVKVIKVEDDAVTILDEDGGARIPLVILSLDLQKRFNYAPPAQNSSASDITPIKARLEWSQRLSQLASVLQEMKKEGASFVSRGTTHAWKDITEIMPTTLSFMTDNGIGKIHFDDLPPEVAKQLTLNSEEVDKWNSEEAQRQQTINQIAVDKQAAEKNLKIAQQEALNKAMAERQKQQEALEQQQIAAKQQEQIIDQIVDAKLKAKEQETSYNGPQVQQAGQQSAQAQQMARQTNGATIAALQSQIEALTKQLEARETNESKNGLYDGQDYTIERQISTLQKQVNALNANH